MKRLQTALMGLVVLMSIWTALLARPVTADYPTTEAYLYYTIAVFDADTREVANFESPAPPSGETMQQNWAESYPGGHFTVLMHYNDPETGQEYTEFQGAGDFPYP